MPAATFSETDRLQVVLGTGIFLPSAPMILSMTMGLQVTPLLAIPAKATAIVSGAISLVPITELAPCASGLPSARCTPKACAVLRMPQRSSFFAIPMNPVLIDLMVDSSAE